MRVKFKSIILNNFMSYEHADINLDRQGYVLVNGINNNPVDNAKSNGTGKSSLFSAISWAITGMTISGGKKVNNIYVDGKTSVELNFTVDDNGYKLIRTANPSNLKIYVNNEDKSGKGIRDTEKILVEYLPTINYLLLNSVIILGQGLPQKFTSNTPSGRKEVLETLSNSDVMLYDLKERVSIRNNVLKNMLNDYEHKLTSLETEQRIHESNLEDLKTSLETYSDKAYEKYAPMLETYKKQLKECETLNDSYEQELHEVNQTITILNNRLAESVNEYNKNKELLTLEPVDELSNQLKQLDIEISNLVAEINKLDSVSDICPTCGQKLPDVHKIDTTVQKLELEKLKINYAGLNEEYLKKEEHNKTIIEAFDIEFNDAQNEYKKQLQECELSRGNLVKNQKMNYEVKSNLMVNISDTESLMNNFINDKTKIENSITECEEKLNNINEEILYNTMKKDEIIEHQSIIDKMNNILKRDFRGYLLINVIDFISRRAKEYCKDLFETDCIEFFLDKNNIVITYDNKDYEVLSGGEKQKIDVIIQLSIRDMLCKYLNFSSNILVLDEITDALDVVGSQQMFNLISTKLNDVEAVYIISHHTDFEIPCDDEITIVKGDDKISRIT